MNKSLPALTCAPIHLVVIATLGLSGCWMTSPQTQPPTANNGAPLLRSLAVTPLVVEKTTLAPAALGTIRDGYASLISQVDDSSLSRQIALRLADVEMLLAEEQQMNGTTGGTDSEAVYQRAVRAYHKVLEQYPDETSRADVLYQLSRAYELQGNRQESAALLNELLTLQPDSVYAREAWFRLGEAWFSEGDYRRAAEAYGNVITTTTYDTFHTMAAYMQGWAYYKLERQQQALVAFDTMLTASFASTTGRLPVAGDIPDIDGLPKGQQKLVRDSLRVMARLFSYRGNGQAVTDFYDEQGDKPHSYLVYNELAQQHLDNDRYLDAADAYLAFARTHAGHPEAVPFYVKHIDAFILGDFPSEVMSAKAGFISTFGAATGNFNAVAQQNRERAAPYLHQYLQELAQAHHSLAQQLQNPERRDDLPPALKNLPDTALQAQAMQAYADAAGYYLEFIDTFPDDEKRPRMQFNLAESYYQAGQFASAIMHYETFAYAYPTHPLASDGAYTALLSYKALLDEVGNDETTSWQEKQRNSRDAFISTFVSDPRAIAVVQTLMQQQFDIRQYQDALNYSHWLLSPPDGVAQQPDASVQHSARLVQAHSYFGLENFVAAEASYASLLASMKKDDEDYGALTRNYAVSMYKQAQQAVEQNDLATAVRHLNNIMTTTPDVDVRITAQYDAATYLLSLQRYDEAQRLFEDFATRFAGHALTASLDTKLLFIFEQTQQWQRAADILYRQWQQTPQQDAGREALLLAADYFEKGGDRSQSLPAYRTYAHTYPAPFETVMEVRFTLSEFYRESGEDSKRRYWLNKLIKGHDEAGSQQTRRSQTLAAQAAMVFADDARNAFTAIKLTQPLAKRLQQKRDALTHAVTAHNKVLAYGVRDYVTMAGHQLGVLYRTLAKDLLASDRPDGLSALELEQYNLLLEEQAYPFEEQAIALLEANARRSWDGIFDTWVQASFTQLSELMPARYRKPEYREVLSAEHY
ncbi:tetratricopeptide repeat protein [Alteromonas sp. CYL-A6]|uniref:tetratricopeptide repeat protein n=1 Tax=Alteromonas nitratireducens TaxID=3390813 RepID=UPI0034BA8DDF